MAGEREARIWREGELRFCQASGTGDWKTAASCTTGLIGYVRAGFAFDKTWNYVTIGDRGYPKHHKFQGVEAPEMTYETLFGITADIPSPATSSGVSTPQVHFELKMRAEEVATASGIWYQFTNCVKIREGFSESEDGNSMAFTFRALSANGPTGSGYLA